MTESKILHAFENKYKEYGGWGEGFLVFKSLDFSSLLPNGTFYQLKGKETKLKKPWHEG